MYVTIDRFEENKAVLELENQEFITVPRVLVDDFSEGDVLFIQKDCQKTKERKDEAEGLLSSLFE